MTAASQQRQVGARDAFLSALGAGTASLGDVFGEVPEDAAHGVLEACIRSGVNYLDTAPLYGNGLSERRVGLALQEFPESSFVISTKAGRTLHPDSPEGRRYDLSRDAILKGLDDSLARLGRDHVEILYIHDPDDHAPEVYATAWPTLVHLRDQGVVKAIGFGMNQWQLPLEFIERLDVDVVMLAGRYTLLDASAGAIFLPACLERGVGVVLAGVFNSGVLASPVDGAWYDYAPATHDQVQRARAIQSLGAEYGVSLPTLALQFAARHPAVTSVVVGVGSSRTVTRNVEGLEQQVPEELWSRLDDLRLLP